MVCSIGECFNELCHILTSPQGGEVGKAKQLEKRSAHSRPVGHVFLFTTQNNKLNKIAGYLSSIRALFVLYLAQLDDNHCGYLHHGVVNFERLFYEKLP